MSTTAPLTRRPASPYARRLARERGIALELLRGSGPNGRIVAADIGSFKPPQPVAEGTARLQASAFGTTIALTALRQLLAAFTEAETPFALDDVVLRAAGCALDDVPAVSGPDGATVGFEQTFGQVVFADIRKASLAPLRARRLAALAAGEDQGSTPARCSLKLIDASDIRPLAMPLLPGRAMRLVVAAGTASAECLLCFDARLLSEDAAAAVLGRFKAYLEVPIRLLA